MTRNDPTPTKTDEPEENEFFADEKTKSEQICFAIGVLRRAQTSVDMDGEEEIDKSHSVARGEGDDDSICYPAKAGWLEATVEKADKDTDRAEQNIEEAIEILEQVRTEVRK